MKTRLPLIAAVLAALVIGYFAINAAERGRLSHTFNRIYAEGT